MHICPIIQSLSFLRLALLITYMIYYLEINLFQCCKNENEKKHSIYPMGSRFNVSVVQFLFPLQKQTFKNIRRSLFYVFFSELLQHFFHGNLFQNTN